MENNEIETRLEKDTYSKDEVAKLLQSEKEFTTRTATRGFVPESEFNTLQEQHNALEAEYAPIREEKANAEFGETVSSTFSGLNGDVERQEDLIKLSGINKDMSQEEITTSITTLKDSGKYNFLFKETVDSGANTTEHIPMSKPVVKNGIVTPKTGLMDKLFKK